MHLSKGGKLIYINTQGADFEVLRDLLGPIGADMLLQCAHAMPGAWSNAVPQVCPLLMDSTRRLCMMARG